MDQKVLQNKHIVITRNIETDPTIVTMLENQGAQVTHLPTIKIEPVDDYSEFDKQVKSFAKFDYLVFSSTNAVIYFCARVKNLKIDLDYSKVKIIAVGSATAAKCKESGLRVDIIPQNFSARGIFNELVNKNLNSIKVFIPSSTIARQELPFLLTESGAEVYSVPVYKNIIPPYHEIKSLLEYIKEKKPDLFIFTSPSTFKNFIKILQIPDLIQYFTGTEIAVIGTVTAAAVRETGLKINIIPDEFTMNSLSEKIVQYYTK